MAVSSNELFQALEDEIPSGLAEEWDKVGLMLNCSGRPVQKVLVCLDVTDSVIKQAKQEQAELIVSHHPFIFHSLRSLSDDRPADRRVMECIRSGISVWSAHTNWDIISGGVNDVLAECLGLQAAQVLQVAQQEKLLKLVVYVPTSHAQVLREALGQAGAGCIGRYSDCFFAVAGTGYFKPLSGTQPYLGQIGQLEQVSEVRLETILPEHLRHNVIATLLKVHPYEEVAYDLYPLELQGQATGLGRIGKVESQSLQKWVEKVKTKLNLASVRWVGLPEQMIGKVAVCGGSGACLIKEAARQGANLLVTGDVKYHEAQEALDLGIALIDAGHFGTEWPSIAHLTQRIKQIAEKNSWEIKVFTSTCEQDFFKIY